MTVTEESQGRLNAFANEPKIEVIENDPSNSNASRILIVTGSLLVIGLIAFSLTIK